MDKVIQEFVLETPGLSAKKILNRCNKSNEQTLSKSTIYMRLRKLKRKGILINKGDSWYVNTKQLKMEGE